MKTVAVIGKSNNLRGQEWGQQTKMCMNSQWCGKWMKRSLKILKDHFGSVLRIFLHPVYQQENVCLTSSHLWWHLRLKEGPMDPSQARKEPGQGNRQMLNNNIWGCLSEELGMCRFVCAAASIKSQLLAYQICPILVPETNGAQSQTWTHIPRQNREQQTQSHWHQS